MEKYKNLNKSTEIGLTISLILVEIGFVLGVFGLVKEAKTGFSLSCISIAINLIMTLFVIVYAMYAYKKPHGNMLKYTFFLFGVCVLLQGVIPISSESTATQNAIKAGVLGFASMLIAYMGGRLHKIEKSKIFMAVVGVMLLAGAVWVEIVMQTFSTMRFIGNFVQTICWGALCFAYVARFEEHKSAGLDDDNQRQNS